MIIKPLYLLADSQLLFQRGEGGLPGRIRAELASPDPKAAYIGASNDDNLEFYDIFKSAMEMMSVSQCHMVPAQLAPEDKAYLEEADLIVLAGGDVECGWRAFEQNGVKDLISRKRYEGATLVAVSAGAVQLGLGALTQSEQPRVFNLFGFAPFYVGAHEEGADWFDLRTLVQLAQSGVRGVGIPAGGGAIYWADGTLEPIRGSLVELVRTEDHVKEGILLPATSAQ